MKVGGCPAGGERGGVGGVEVGEGVPGGEQTEAVQRSAVEGEGRRELEAEVSCGVVLLSYVICYISYVICHISCII